LRTLIKAEFSAELVDEVVCDIAQAEDLEAKRRSAESKRMVCPLHCEKISVEGSPLGHFQTVCELPPNLVMRPDRGIPRKVGAWLMSHKSLLRKTADLDAQDLW
jgi:hypothetical protein